MLKPAVCIAAIIAFSISFTFAMHKYLHASPDGAPFDHSAICPDCGIEAHMHCKEDGYWSGKWTCFKCKKVFTE